MMVCAVSSRIVRLLFALALTFTVAPASAATIMVFGDSLSAGYGLKPGEGWVSLLERRLQKEKADYKVVNASISGETTTGGRNRIAGALKTHHPSIVVVELGANDGLRGGTVEQTKSNLEAIVDACRKAGSRVVLVGIRLPPNYGMAYTDKFRQVFPEVARQKKTALVPFLFEGFADKPDYFQADGLHPAPNAQPIMLDLVWKELQPMLKKTMTK
ncbi:MAG TPA: arylesterase [Burkholderiales bacterium]|nr:arylesterase [Burkholderiales bacterium]